MPPKRKVKNANPIKIKLAPPKKAKSVFDPFDSENENDAAQANYNLKNGGKANGQHDADESALSYVQNSSDADTQSEGEMEPTLPINVPLLPKKTQPNGIVTLLSLLRLIFRAFFFNSNCCFSGQVNAKLG